MRLVNGSPRVHADGPQQVFAGPCSAGFTRGIESTSCERLCAFRQCKEFRAARRYFRDGIVS